MQFLCKSVWALQNVFGLFSDDIIGFLHHLSRCTSTGTLRISTIHWWVQIVSIYSIWPWNKKPRSIQCQARFSIRIKHFSLIFKFLLKFVIFFLLTFCHKKYMAKKWVFSYQSELLVQFQAFIHSTVAVWSLINFK